MLNRTVIGVCAIAIAIAVMAVFLVFCRGGDGDAERPRSAATALVDADLPVRARGADALAFTLAAESIVEVNVEAPGAHLFDAYLMSEADWKAVKIPGGLPRFTAQKVATSSLRGNVPAGSWRVVVHDAHQGNGMTVHVRVVENPPH